MLAALLHRERTGEGQLVTVNMLDALTTLQMQELSVFTVGGKSQQRSAEPHAHVFIRAPYGVFRTSDGYLALAFADLHVLGTVTGALGVLLGIYDQYLSATTAERWVIVFGLGASGVGLALGLANGGLW